jgi:hypothetical protein
LLPATHILHDLASYLQPALGRFILRTLPADILARYPILLSAGALAFKEELPPRLRGWCRYSRLSDADTQDT